MLSYSSIFSSPSGIYDGITIILFILLGCALVALGVLIYLSWRDKEYAKLVRENSRWFHNIQSINSHTKFIDVAEDHRFLFDLSSKAQFDRFDSDNAFQQVVIENKPTLNKWLQITTLNAQENARYQPQIERAYERTPKEEIPIYHLNTKLWDSLEKRMCSANILIPALLVNIIIVAEYTSPAGRNSYHKSYKFDRDDLCAMLKHVKELEEFQSSKEYQRKMMSPKLRYDVLKRDGFRCAICGRGREDGVKLEVDHIIPVSKGGKTKMSNLQTLCMECNRGKGAQYDEDEEYN